MKQEKVVIATSSEKTIVHACFQENPRSSACTLQLVSACCLKFVFRQLVQNHNSAKALRLLRTGNH